MVSEGACMLDHNHPLLKEAVDRRLLYVDMIKQANAVVSAGVQTVAPETVRAIVQTFAASMNAAAMISSG